MHKKRVEVWESTMILLAFFLVKILYGVSGAIREDITQHGITVGPGGGRKINQQAQFTRRCPKDHSYPLNYGKTCSRVSGFIDLCDGLPQGCSTGQEFAWGDPDICGIPTFMTPCPDPNGVCNTYLEDPVLVEECPESHPYALDNGSSCSAIEKRIIEAAVNPLCDGSKTYFGTPKECGYQEAIIDCPSTSGVCTHFKSPSECISPGLTLLSADPAWRTHTSSKLANALTDSGCEINRPFNYFVGEDLPEHKSVFDFGCTVLFLGIRIHNAKNVHVSNTGTRQFSISSSLDQVTWTQLLEHELADPRGLACADIPLVVLDLTPTLGRYMELKLQSFYGTTYALRFFGVDFIV